MQQSATARGERRIRGGLDNAARQAEARGLRKMLVIDADCHEREPFSLFSKYVRPSFRKSLFKWDAEANPWYAKIVTNRVKRPEVSYPRPMLPAEIVETFCHRMEEIGITKSVVLPDAMLGLATDHRNPDYEVEAGGALLRVPEHMPPRGRPRNGGGGNRQHGVRGFEGRDAWGVRLNDQAEPGLSLARDRVRRQDRRLRGGPRDEAEALPGRPRGGRGEAPTLVPPVPARRGGQDALDLLSSVSKGHCAGVA